MLSKQETGMHYTRYKILKYRGDLKSRAEAETRGLKPYEVLEGEGNVMVNVGIQAMLNLLTGLASPTVFSHANAYLGVGTSSTAATASDTNLGANGVWVGMDSGYPSLSGQTLTFEATFGSAVANQAWNEWAIANGNNPPTALLLNHKAPVTLGTKSSGETLENSALYVGPASDDYGELEPLVV